MPLAAGTRIGHYEILGPLGAGGMGEVYRAADRRLARDVALKVLPESTARHDAEIERFRSEARAIAALNHPNIVTIYSVETADDVPFLTMELVEGTTLDGRILADGLPIETVLSSGAQLADALVAAHAKGIIHRDLKPANIMLTDAGRVKVLDFGLAKITEPTRLSEAETAAHTRPGLVMGTLAYMSPEQLEGLPLDARSDIFSFGVVLYEMLAGRRPFSGHSAASVASAILRDQAPAVDTARSDVPPALQRIVARCIEKSRERRYQSAFELAEDLAAIARGSSGSLRRPSADMPERSIVVLPFANLSPDPANEYLGDGLTEEIITDLAKVRALSVISRTSAMQLRGVRKGTRTLARELGVRYVVDGSVRKAGDSLRITAQLVDAVNDTPVWSEKFAGTMADVFEVQERVSREIVQALDITLTTEEHRRLGERPIGDPRAFELFLQARQEIRRYLPHGRSRC